MRHAAHYAAGCPDIDLTTRLFFLLAFHATPLAVAFTMLNELGNCVVRQCATKLHWLY